MILYLPYYNATHDTVCYVPSIAIVRAPFGIGWVTDRPRLKLFDGMIKFSISMIKSWHCGGQFFGGDVYWYSDN